MNSALALALTLVSGVCWTIVYLEGIRLGFRDKTCAMPLWALALNFSWEIFNSILGYADVGLNPQVIINFVWAIFDVFLVITYFRYGYRYVKARISYRYFIVWSLLVFAVAAVVEYAFVLEFGLALGRAYAAFLQNLLMSGCSSPCFSTDRRGRPKPRRRRQQMAGNAGADPPVRPDRRRGPGGADAFLLTVGLLCSLFDILYIVLLSGRVRGLAASA